MSTSQNHYEVLGVRPDADTAAIKRAYYAKMRLYHPDNFIPERRRLETGNDQLALAKLDKKIDDAKKQTQRINQAYDILSDTDSRAYYDRQRKMAAAPPLDPEYYRRTVKSRPHRATSSAGKSVEEKFPLAILIIFLVITLVVSAGLSSLFQFQDDYLVLPTVDKDTVPVGSVDATATAYARRPTATPRPLESYVSAGDALLAAGRFGYAIEQYTQALDRDPQAAEIYYRRGLAYLRDNQLDQAHSDFDAALALDADFADAYRERGVLFVTLALANPDDAAQVAAARQDFARYAELGGDMQDPTLILAQRQLTQVEGN